MQDSSPADTDRSDTAAGGSDGIASTIRPVHWYIIMIDHRKMLKNNEHYISVYCFDRRRSNVQILNAFRLVSKNQTGKHGPRIGVCEFGEQ